MFLGIEIGGTKLQLAVGAADGAPFVGFERAVIQREKGAQAILAQIERLGSHLLQRFDVTRIGFGFGGPINAGQGQVTTSHQVTGWDDFPLVEWCQETLGVPAVLGNDCDVAALAEAHFGAGRGHKVVFYVTVGTGIGGGLVVDGQSFGRGRPAIAEIGQLSPWTDAEGSTARVESLASGLGIAAQAHRLIARAEDVTETNDLLNRCGGDADDLTARHIAEAAAAGNSLASNALAESINVLGWAIAQTVTLLAPNVIVVGGGVSLIGEDLFFRPLRQAVQTHVFRPSATSFEIVPAQLGEDVVLHGALALAAS